MLLEDFKSGNFVTQPAGYKAFMPAVVNESFTWKDASLNTLLEQATLQLGGLNSYSRFVPDIDMFIRMHVVKEATVSSRIEGTQTNLEDALIKKSEVNPEKRDDWQEVDNYIKAMNHAITRLRKLPLSSRLLKETHKKLLNQSRGQHRLPGEFRTSQNWIGGASLNDATFIPPPASEVDTLMSDLEHFIHNDEIQVPHLIRIAIAHYQFETIHPFLDGNGRIGRLLITLYLINHHILDRPLLYLSDFFEKNRGLYYDNLMAVRRNNDLIQWIKFFLQAVAQTSKVATASLHKIMALREDCQGIRILVLGKKTPNARVLLEHLFGQPIVTAQEVARLLKVSPVSAYKLIYDFENLGILKESTGFKRNRYFSFAEYLKLFK